MTGKNNISFSCEYDITFWLKNRRWASTKNILKDDILCIGYFIYALSEKGIIYHVMTYCFGDIRA